MRQALWRTSSTFHSPYHVRCPSIIYRARENEACKDEKTQLEEVGSTYTLYSIDYYYLNYPSTAVVNLLANHTRIGSENSIIIIIEIASVNGT